MDGNLSTDRPHPGPAPTATATDPTVTGQDPDAPERVEPVDGSDRIEDDDAHDGVDNDEATKPTRGLPVGPGTLAGTPWGRWDFVVAGAVGLAVVLVAMVWRSEITTTDPWHYVWAGIAFPQDTWVPLGYTRYGMILPVIPVAHLWGAAQATFYFWAFAASGMLGASLYLLGRRWWGWVGGALAVALTVTNSIVFLNLSRYYPDVISTALVLVALALAVAARGRQAVGGRRTVPLLLLSGFFLGWSFEARETALFAWVVVAIVLWVPGRALRNAAWTAAPVLGWAVLDISISAWAYADPLLKLHTFTRQDLSQSQIAADQAVMSEFVGRPRLDYLVMIPQHLLGRTGGSPVAGGTWFLLLGVVALLGLMAKDRATRLSSLGLLSTYFFFVGIGGFFFPQHPAGRLDIERYWVPFVPFMALAVSGIVVTAGAWVGRALGGRRVLAAFATGALAVLVLAVPTVSVVREATTNSLLAPQAGTAMAQARGYFAAHNDPSATVWSDFHTERLLPIYRRGTWGGSRLWTMRVDTLSSRHATPAPGDYVILTNTTDPSCYFCSGALRRYENDKPGVTLPSAGWVPVFTSTEKGLTIYRVGAGS